MDFIFRIVALVWGFLEESIGIIELGTDGKVSEKSKNKSAYTIHRFFAGHKYASINTKSGVSYSDQISQKDCFDVQQWLVTAGALV